MVYLFLFKNGNLRTVEAMKIQSKLCANHAIGLGTPFTDGP